MKLFLLLAVAANACIIAFDVSFPSAIFAGDPLQVSISGNASARVSTYADSTEYVTLPALFTLATDISSDDIDITLKQDGCTMRVSTTFPVLAPTCELNFPKDNIVVYPQRKMNFKVSTRGAGAVRFTNPLYDAFFGYGNVTTSHSMWIGFYTALTDTSVAALAVAPDNSTSLCFVKPIHFVSTTSFGTQFTIVVLIASLPISIGFCLCLSNKQWTHSFRSRTTRILSTD